MADEKKLEFTDEQKRRIEELNDAAYEYLKVVAEKSIPRDNNYLEEINTEAAQLLYNKGMKVYYPGIETNEGGIRKVVDWYNSNMPDYKRLVTLILRDADPDYPLGKLSVIGIKTSLPDDELIIAIKAASKEYLNTPEGRETWECNCQNFNWGDFDIYVPNHICQKHGFYKLNSAPDLLDLDFNEQLAEPSEENGED